MYYLKNHLGSIRATIDEAGEVVAAQDYYPFGEVIQGRSFVSGGLNEKYKFTGKERDTETNYDYFGARFYDSELGRWLSVDPLAELSPGFSPYNYVLNNPLIYIDLAGLDTFNVNINNREVNRTTVENSTSHVYMITLDGEVINTYTLDVNESGLVQFPASADGFGRYGTVDEGGDHYLQPLAAAALFGLVGDMNSRLDNFRIDFGDMSTSTGGAPGNDHQMHGGPAGYSGVSIDFRYLNTNNQSYQGLATSQNFSSTSNYMLYGRAGQWGFGQNYNYTSNQASVFSSSGFSHLNARRISGHNNHGHLTFTGF